MIRNALTIQGLGREIRGTPTLERPTGLFVKRDGWQGWEGLPAGRREALARALAHGEFDVPVKLPARVITIDGWVIARTIPELRNLSQSLTGWGASGDRFALSVEHQEQDLTATARRLLAEADDTGRRHGPWRVAAFQAQLVAADPRKYGDVKRFPESGLATSIDVSHDGNFLAFPVIEVPAAPASYAIQTPAGVYNITGATPGGTHRVDLRTGRVTRNDVWMPDVGRGPLWAAPDGATSTIVLSSPGRALVTNTFV
ncbi:hypothetical protein [Herbiconiux sp.]|uniref:hypothetical protein n=1 Tax=Herbiconiux sp. TaxID=1871186 RepID=UPI0025C2AD4B|nr:hypothetical protein [Herbiconiux sp.]